VAPIANVITELGARSFIESTRDDGLRVPLSTGDTSNWN
jgi:hypothetical protein